MEVCICICLLLMARPVLADLVEAGPQQRSSTDPVKEGLDKVDELKSFFREAKAYLASSAKDETNLKFAAVKASF